MSTKVLANPLMELQKFGQSVWLDYIRRDLITTGELKRLIDEDGLRGMTSNPAIFEKAIGGSDQYADVMSKAGQTAAMQVYEQIAIRDIQDAADILKSVYKETKGRDGYISLEVSPFLANDTAGTLTEARRLWKEVGRENVMIKVPGTEAGIPAIKQLISEGININVTLLFSLETYVRVAEAYIAGLQELASKGGDVSKVASVASFFISRIDSLVDKLAEDKLESAKDDAERKSIESIIGKVAIANGKITYKRYEELFSSPEWKKLAGKGAQTQRVLWASTSTKNPKYPDTLYVDELIGADTVNTIPPATFDAFRDHGHAKETLSEGLDESKRVMETLGKIGISMKQVTDQLVEEGVKLFADAFEKLLSTVDKQRGAGEAGKTTAINELSYKLPEALNSSVQAKLKDWTDGGKTKRLWDRDASLWTGEDEAKWLDWLHVTEQQLKDVSKLKSLAEEVKKAGFTHALLLGMGGSSLCPEVFSETFGTQSGSPVLHVLDSTDPAQVLAKEKALDLAKTVFIVSSKSGSTLEPNIFKQYFYAKVAEKVGAEKAGEHFIAVTDPGSNMQKAAEQGKFRHIFYGLPGIGGRYSALSNFGMVPAAVMGMDVERFLNNTEEMVKACSSNAQSEKNPGVLLGVIMGTLASAGRDKLTLVTSPAIYDVGAWLEQLLAESTGKQGKGIIPVDREALGSPDIYGSDRLFAYIRLEGKADAEQDRAVEALEKAGHPVIRIHLKDIYNLGQEFFRWEIATAVAGSIIKINAFNQPDVEASKIVTRKLTDEFEKNGALPSEAPFFEEDGIKLFSDDKNVRALQSAVGDKKSLVAYIKAHLDRIKEGDYFAELAYIQMNQEHREVLQEIRQSIRDSRRVATCLGFGPRFLHSTGQAYKGGPNSGVFVQITCDDATDVAVPDQKYTFGIVKAAQARGDFQVLVDRERRALRIHVGKDVKADLGKLKAAFKQALTK